VNNHPKVGIDRDTRSDNPWTSEGTLRKKRQAEDGTVVALHHVAGALLGNGVLNDNDGG